MRLAPTLSALVVSTAAFAGIFPISALKPSSPAIDMMSGAMPPMVVQILDQPALRDRAQSPTRDVVATIRESLVDFVNELKAKPGLGANQATKRPATRTTPQDIDGAALTLKPKLDNVHIIVRPARPMTEAERAQARAERAKFERLKGQQDGVDEADLALEQAVQHLRDMAAP
jgi:hypothetical protein